MEQKEYEDSEITPIGITDWRIKRPFGIKSKDRLRHISVLGMSGVGKTTLLQNMIISDLEARPGRGIAVLDPHGDVSQNLLHYVPTERIPHVIYFNPGDDDCQISFNPLFGIPAHLHHLAASGLISTFARFWSLSWGPRLEHILRFTLLTLLEYQEATLLDIQPLLTNPLFRERILSRVTSAHLITFWRNEFEKYSPALRAEAIAPILNKMGLFAASLPLRKTVGQRIKGLDIQEVMNQGNVLIVNLAKGILGEDASSLLGAMLISAMQLAAMARADKVEDERKPFYVFVDEVHSFMTTAFINLLSEARKFRLSLCIAHQYIEQLPPEMRAAVFGNIGTLIVFRVGATDSEYLAKEFYPVFKEEDFVSLPKHSLYIKLMIDGVTSKPFSATTMPTKAWKVSNKARVIAALQERAIKEHVNEAQIDHFASDEEISSKPMTLF